MSRKIILPQKKRQKVPLSFRIAVCFVFAAIVPLLVMLLFIFTQTTPALIDQANKAMTNDANTRTQLIDNYLQERLFDVVTISQSASQIPNVQRMLTVDQPGSAAFQKDVATGGYYVVEAGSIRSKDYLAWSIFTKTGHMLLSNPATSPLQPHGNFLVPPEELSMVNAGKTFISPVYYSPQTRKSTVDIYGPLTASEPTGTQPAASSTPPAIIGFLRATLDLAYIQGIVQGDAGNNGSGSYAYIVDGNGVRIIDTNARERFTSLAPLSASTQQLISSEKRYGSDQPVPVVAQPAIARNVQSRTPLASFQIQLAGNNQQFRVVQRAMNTTLVAWNYVVLSPVSSETAVAQQQQQNIILLAILAAVLMTGLGLLIGQNISLPILGAVKRLLRNSESLRDLAIHQQDAASSQTWVVESSQAGLQEVRYYTKATKVASRRLLEITHPQADAHAAKIVSRRLLTTTLASGQSGYLVAQNNGNRQEMEPLASIALYLETAIAYQHKSNQKLEISLKVAAEVAEQLNNGAASARESADMLENIVEELRAVIGR